MIVEIFLIGLVVIATGWILTGRSLGAPGPAADAEPLPLEETARGQALIAIKDLEFDHATGKVADPDYQSLRERYLREAAVLLAPADLDPAESLVTARRAVLEGRGVDCPRCGPRPEADARFCSSCGRRLG